MGAQAVADLLESSPHTGLANAIFSKVQQRVLGILFGNPSRSFYANEIIALANCGTGAVQRELARLASTHLVSVSRIGNQKHYQANAQSPVFEELRGLILKTSGLVDVLRMALVPLAAQINAAFVYGSVAKGTDAATSDIDLMVLSDNLTYADLFTTLEEAATRLGRTINPTVYTHQELAKRLKQNNAFIKRVVSQAKIWIVGTENNFARAG